MHISKNNTVFHQRKEAEDGINAYVEKKSNSVSFLNNVLVLCSMLDSCGGANSGCIVESLIGSLQHGVTSAATYLSISHHDVNQLCKEEK
jgi:hypothetical protein